MKKILSLLFCFYILALTLTPCLDNGRHADAAIHQATGTDNPGERDHHEECCSPFCTCSCCGCLFETVSTFVFEKDSQMPATRIFFFDPQTESRYIFKIWEPPKA